MRTVGRAVLAALGACLVLAGCKKKQPEYITGPVIYPGGTPPGAPAPAPGATPPTPMTPPGSTPSGAPPAVGFGCARDSDMQCPFGRCISGRCGGCSDASQCKPNAQCLPTWFGNACLPGASPPAAGTPAPAPPSPGPAATPAPQPVPQPVPNPAAGTDPFERARALCVARINEYRARVAVGPVSRRPDKEACGDNQARSDARTRTAHGAFGQCRESAQNECPGWSGSLDVVVERCLAMMFAEGPGSGPEHGHYVNMTDRDYRGVACGIFSGSDGEVWMVHDFFR
jgi:hypothetical protein